MKTGPLCCEGRNIHHPAYGDTQVEPAWETETSQRLELPFGMHPCFHRGNPSVLGFFTFTCCIAVLRQGHGSTLLMELFPEADYNAGMVLSISAEHNE